MAWKKPMVSNWIDDDFPFTHEELVAAFSKVMPVDEAREFVQHLSRRPDYQPDGVETGNWVGGRGSSWADGTLDLLASVSPELAERVREYRRQFEQEQ